MEDLRVVCFDMDGTLIRNTNSVRFICALAGKREAAEEIEAMEDTGELNWIDADYIKADMASGLNTKKLKETFDEHVVLISGIEDTIRELNKRNIKSILVTAGPLQVAEILGERFGFDRVYGSIFETENGAFTGKIVKHLGESGKLHSLQEYCREKGYSPAQCAAVGDSTSDVEVFRYSGKSIAINHSKSLEGLADEYIRTEDIRDILRFL